MRRFFARLANLFRSYRAEGEMAREIEAHMDLLQEDFARRGLSPQEASLAARRAYGSVEQAKELHREARSFVWIEQLVKDVRYSARNLARSPGFTLVAVTALALGIGVNATIFGIYNAVALKQLPVADPDRVMRIKRFFGTNEYAYTYNFAYTEYQYLREHNTVFSGLTAATYTIPVMASLGSVPEHLHGYAVSANYFSDLGVKARVGRTFLADEDRSPGANPVVVTSYRFWQHQFQGSPNAIGQTIKLNGVAYTIIGVAPQEFTGTDAIPAEAAFWAPLSMLDQLRPDFGPATHSTWREEWRDSDHPGFQMMARLTDGVSRARAQAEIDLLTHQYLAGRRENLPTISVTLQKASYFGASGDFWVKMFAGVVFGIVSMVLVVACANVANMLLARGVTRQREIGIRLALGASRSRVVRQLLTESILLSLLGGAAGILLSAAASQALWVSLNAFVPSSLGLLAEPDFRPDIHLLIYGLILSLMTGVLFGLAPALQSTRPDIYNAAKAEASPFGAGIGRSRVRTWLLGIQVTVSVLLLVVSGGLLDGAVRSFTKARDLGFEPLDTYILLGDFGSERATANISKQRLRNRLETLTEVGPVAVGSVSLGGAGKFPMKAGQRNVQATTTWASDRYFETLGIPIVQGRSFTRQEGSRDAPVAIISESTTKRLWPNEDSIGKRITLNLLGKFTDYSVVGVAKDVRFTVITEIDPLHVYLPVGQKSPFNILFRIHGNRDKALMAVQSAVGSVDSTALATLELVSLEAGPVSLQRGMLHVVGAFAGILTLLSLTLAAVGIYGVMAFVVSQRTREIGIRMALGATHRTTIGSVMLQTMGPVVIGTLAGVAGSLALERIPFFQAARQLSVAPPTLADPILWAELALVLFIAVLASVVPVRRAIRVDPVVALRHD